MASVQSEKPAPQPGHAKPSIVTARKTNKSHQTCRERMRVMANKMFHHDQAQLGNHASPSVQKDQSAITKHGSSQTASAKTKKKEANCMPKIRDHMKNMTTKKNKEGTTGDKGDSSSSSDESDHGKGTIKKN